jgi:hypothetical protein
VKTGNDFQPHASHKKEKKFSLDVVHQRQKKDSNLARARQENQVKEIAQLKVSQTFSFFFSTLNSKEKTFEPFIFLHKRDDDERPDERLTKTKLKAQYYKNDKNFFLCVR